MNHANNFTLLRLILATLVMLGHFKILAGISLAEGLYGYSSFAVDAFFVISGFLVYASFDNAPDMRCFFIRRFFRIYPLYALVIIMQAIAMLWVIGINASMDETASYLASNLVLANFLQHNIGGIFDNNRINAVNPSLWTLKIEAAFYLLVPVLWWVSRRYHRLLLTGLYIASTAYFIFFALQDEEILAKQLPGQLRFFVVGIALYRYRDFFTPPRALALLVGALLFALCSLKLSLLFAPFYPLALGLLVLIFTFHLPVIPLKNDISYGVYLLHAPLIQFALLFNIFDDSITFLLLLSAATYALAFIVELVVEQPLVRLGKRLSA